MMIMMMMIDDDDDDDDDDDGVGGGGPSPVFFFFSLFSQGGKLLYNVLVYTCIYLGCWLIVKNTHHPYTLYFTADHSGLSLSATENGLIYRKP
jgi:hypothetical protein